MTRTTLKDFLSTPNRDITLPYVDSWGTQRWFNLKGQAHRDNDLPAVLYEAGGQDWYLNGLHHRVGGPAIIGGDETGGEWWYQHGILHRVDGPAVIWDDQGCEEYYLNGQRHRIDGPAITHSSGKETYFLEGVELPYEV